MGLTNFFRSKAARQTIRFTEAVIADDLATVGQMLDEGYLPNFDYLQGGFELESSTVALQDKASPALLRLFVQKAREQLNRPNFFGSGKKYDTDGQKLASNFIATKRFDLLQMLIDEKVDFNTGNSGFHPIGRLLSAYREGTVDKERTLALFDGMSSNGLKGIDDLYGNDYMKWDSLSCQIAAADLPEAFDLAAHRGLDLHASQEQALRFAARFEKEALCRHLIENHGADAAVAIDAEKKDEEGKIGTLFLTSLGLKSGAQGQAPTIESLSIEVKMLRENIAELTNLVRQQAQAGGVTRLDKKSLMP